MTTFAAPASSLDSKAFDATKHVNYTLGMVLGVDDFNQEFAWLSGRDRWLARDAIGYGTLTGLHVSVEKPSKGPRVNVTSGAALTPRGQLVCVKPAQCAYLNDWLALHQSDVVQLLGSPAGSPSLISLYLTLCYRDCAVDLVPIPGEPCRAEDELMAPSRLVDSFALELRTTPPDQSEEDLVREFGAWLRALPFGGGGPYASLQEFEDDLRAMAKEMAQAITVSPMPSPAPSPVPPHFPGGSPISTLHLDPDLAPQYYERAFRVWIEDIRPLVHQLGAGGCVCGCMDDKPSPRPDECVLLARLDIPIVHSSGKWVVSDAGTVTIDESQRPMLLHLRLLQELVNPSSASASSTPVPFTNAPQSTIVASGLLSAGANDAATPRFGNIKVATQAGSLILITFNGYKKPAAGSHNYSVTAMAKAGPVGNPTIALQDFDNAGILLKVTNGAANIADATLKTVFFNIEVRRVE